MHWTNGFGGGGLVMILFWILIIVGILALIKWIVSQTSSIPKADSAMDILKNRYAQGEISKTDFLSMKKDLE